MLLFLCSSTAEVFALFFQTGCLLSSLAEKGLPYKVTKNVFRNSILWSVNIPNDIAHALFSQNDDCDTVMHNIFIHHHPRVVSCNIS